RTDNATRGPARPSHARARLRPRRRRSRKSREPVRTVAVESIAAGYSAEHPKISRRVGSSEAILTRMSTHGKRALVSGGAGLIGSHVVDLLVREGWQVRVLDNLEPNTHRRGKPAWINPRAEFIEGDMRHRETIRAALDKIDIVFHQAAYGGYMPEISKYVHVNSLGTAQMLEVIREKNLPI